MVLILLCSLLQLVSSAAPVGADITEPGNWGVVTVNTVNPAGDPVVAHIRLLTVINGAEELLTYNVEGVLETQVTSGNYVAYAYKNGGFLAKSDVFDVAWHEHKYVVLAVSTVDIQDFAVSPEQRASGELSRVRIDYSVVNLEAEMPNGEVRLTVTRNGEPFETVTIANPAPLPQTLDGPFYYTPARSWAQGEYGFSLQLYADSQLYAETDELTFSKIGSGGLATWLLIVIVIAGVLAAAAVCASAFFLLKRRRKGEKPARAERKRHEEKPVLKAEEPAPKPEAAPPVEPARHLEEPVQGEEPVGQPASSLSSVSTLKARMAALGRDQGIAQETDQEPDADNEGSSASALKGRMASLDRNHGPVKDADKGPDTDNKGPGQAGK
ncbi:MAG: hypothetical protein JW753_02850 [Dehalococcoidia bacterium]|nr:hypothetical protein [Dehalococcoidia bacterium]